MPMCGRSRGRGVSVGRGTRPDLAMRLPTRRVGAHRFRHAATLRGGRSLRGAAIGLEQPAEPRLARELIDAINQRRAVGVVCANQPVANPLMGSAVVIAGDELAHDVVEVCQAKHDKVIECLVLQALDPSLDEGIQVGRPRPDWLHCDAAFLEYAVKVGCVLAVVVTNNGFATQVLSLSMSQERMRLRRHPGGIRLEGRRRDKRAPRCHMNKCHRENLAWSGESPDVLAEEIDLPKRLGVDLQELTPRAFAALGMSRAALPIGVLGPIELRRCLL